MIWNWGQICEEAGVSPYEHLSNLFRQGKNWRRKFGSSQMDKPWVVFYSSFVFSWASLEE